MKLLKFDPLGNYKFRFHFENGETIESNLQSLLVKKVTRDQLHTARIDPDWKCLEFDGGMIDIAPRTLYEFCKNQK